MCMVISTMSEIERIVVEAAASFGYSCLKDEQEKALKAFAGGNDVFVSLPTGYGKSLCYALLTSIFDKKRRLTEKESIAMIVSPLIALMKDQSSSFTEKGIVSGYVSDKESTN